MLTNIPYIQGLQELNCSDCQMLTNIPCKERSSKELEELNCYQSPLLTNREAFLSSIGQSSKKDYKYFIVIMSIAH